ncbi:hypothetical protein C490_05227 [Natronobacterium gregoryi SP2]|uniref:Uncharacterized protein n=1 Tax=Natronobacterium gregoryi (strain ATCC 43098 / DSM 3393 / CCM 3738 / CIP 104747 / IAM 13177 / JCM 8860 / NBRC 102187 / NCIMB 2189 / SP2) TaxID=797304 RepID=L9YCE9_NATGS|nr:hypothetical protein C490_05227 [Natronobacterium gregoryi SP2]
MWAEDATGGAGAVNEGENVLAAAHDVITSRMLRNICFVSNQLPFRADRGARNDTKRVTATTARARQWAESGGLEYETGPLSQDSSCWPLVAGQA